MLIDASYYEVHKNVLYNRCFVMVKWDCNKLPDREAMTFSVFTRPAVWGNFRDKLRIYEILKKKTTLLFRWFHCLRYKFITAWYFYLIMMFILTVWYIAPIQYSIYMCEHSNVCPCFCIAWRMSAQFYHRFNDVMASNLIFWHLNVRFGCDRK